MKTKNLFLMAAVVMMAAVSCKKDPQPAPEGDAVSVDKTEVSFDATGEPAQVIKVTSNGDWAVSGQAEWIKVTPTSSRGSDGTISVSAAKNEDTKVREGSFVITRGKATATVKVTQAAATPAPVDPTKIKDAASFTTFYETMATYPEGTVFELVNDIDLAGFTKNKEALADLPAGITLDGKGFAIKNWNNSGYPIFQFIRGTIQNLVIDSSCTISYDASRTQFGILASQNYNLVKNCTNKASLIADAFTITAQAHWGMFVGINRNAVEDCVNEGNLTLSSYTAADNLRFGAISGSHAENTETKTLYIKNCVNKGNFTVNKTDDSAKDINLGGIVGHFDSNTEASIESCTNYGTLTVTAAAGFTQAYAGGIAGQLRGGIISSCKSFGTVSSVFATGGVVGKFDINKVKETGIVTMDGCAVNAELSGTSAGLVFGTCKNGTKYILGSNNAIKVAGKVNTTPIDASNYANYLCGATGTPDSSINAKYEVVSK